MDNLNKALAQYEDYYKSTFYHPLAVLGVTWLPELLFNSDHKLDDYYSLAGVFTYTFTLLFVGEIFGVKGLFIHSLFYGGLSALDALMMNINPNKPPS